MKKPVCEICGESEFLKDNGVFVCQSCGTKYSAEELKKLLTEVEGDKVPEATPTTAPEATPTPATQLDADELYKSALAAFETGDLDRVELVCGAIIQQDPNNRDALKLMARVLYAQHLKGRNCLKAACLNLVAVYSSQSEKSESERAELLEMFRSFAEGNIEYRMKLFSNIRPSNVGKTALINAYNECISIINDVFDGLEVSNLKAEYTASFNNVFVDNVYAVVEELWANTVAKNYFRDAMNPKTKNPFAREDSRWVIPDLSLYRPTYDIWNQFVSESDVLLNLLQFAETKFNPDSDRDTVKGIFYRISYIAECVMLSGSWKQEMGLEHIWDKAKVKGWKEEFFLSAESKNRMDAITREYLHKYHDLAEQYSKSTNEEKKQKREQYWEEHADERKALVLERDELKKKLESIRLKEKRNEVKIDELNEIIKNGKLPEEHEVERLEYLIEELEEQYKKFKVVFPKDRKALRDRIDNVEKPKLFELKKKLAEDKMENIKKMTAEIERLRSLPKDDIDGIQKRIFEINTELSKDR